MTRRIALAFAATALALASSACGGGDDSGQEGSASSAQEVPAAKITNLAEAVEAAECELVDTKADSRDHVAEISASIDYPTNPPTAGKHFGAAAEDGIYAETPPDITVVHSHEHGRVVIWFKPGLSRADRDGLHALVEDDFDKMLLIPRAEMPFDVAATAWSAEPEPLGTGRLLGCATFSRATYDALRTFRDEHRGKGPETIP